MTQHRLEGHQSLLLPIQPVTSSQQPIANFPPKGYPSNNHVTIYQIIFNFVKTVTHLQKEIYSILTLLSLLLHPETILLTVIYDGMAGILYKYMTAKL